MSESVLHALFSKSVAHGEESTSSVAAFYFSDSEQTGDHLMQVAEALHPDAMLRGPGGIALGARFTPSQALSYLQAIQADDFAMDCVPRSDTNLKDFIHFAQTGYSLNVSWA